MSMTSMVGARSLISNPKWRVTSRNGAVDHPEMSYRWEGGAIPPKLDPESAWWR